MKKTENITDMPEEKGYQAKEKCFFLGEDEQRGFFPAQVGQVELGRRGQPQFEDQRPEKVVVRGRVVHQEALVDQEPAQPAVVGMGAVEEGVDLRFGDTPLEVDDGAFSVDFDTPKVEDP